MRFSVSVSVLVLCSGLLAAQDRTKPASHSEYTHRHNELTLAGLRPGRDTITKAVRQYRLKSAGDNETAMSWHDKCQDLDLYVNVDKTGKIESVRISQSDTGNLIECYYKDSFKPWWVTGNKLSLRDTASRVTDIYGKPDSRSPSTKGGQQLELLYYAFDWAGPEVPQVMEVLCTPEKDGKPGRVVEITLAGPSL
jgi:hypothetical protein